MLVQFFLPLRMQLASLVPRARNLYGATEGTVAQTLGPEGGSTHVGWAIDPAAVRPELSTDPEREGEVVMVGPQVARGYWRGAAFHGSFHTGDRGRFDADGALHVLGRMDHQVKVRGHRVELGEVEAVLRAIEGVRDAVAVLHGVSLVALCEPHASGDGVLAAAPDDWSDEVARALPAPFRPAPLLVGPLPRLPNGKANRQLVAALLAEELGARCGSGGTPRAGTESLVAGLWEEVLQLGGRVGRDDNWFALGGTSLGAVRLLRQLPGALAAAGRRVDRKVAWCGLHRHPGLRGYAAFLDWAAAAPEAALADPALLDLQGPLAAAAGRGDAAACRELLLQGAGADGQWRPGSPCETPLHAAARHGHVEVVELCWRRAGPSSRRGRRRSCYRCTWRASWGAWRWRRGCCRSGPPWTRGTGTDGRRSSSRSRAAQGRWWTCSSAGAAPSTPGTAGGARRSAGRARGAPRASWGSCWRPVRRAGSACRPGRRTSGAPTGAQRCTTRVRTRRAWRCCLGPRAGPERSGTLSVNRREATP
ncbi:unnamed protein product, partial [Prorocentrum cordatum]